MTSRIRTLTGLTLAALVAVPGAQAMTQPTAPSSEVATVASVDDPPHTVAAATPEPWSLTLIPRDVVRYDDTYHVKMDATGEIPDAIKQGGVARGAVMVTAHMDSPAGLPLWAKTQQLSGVGNPDSDLPAIQAIHEGVTVTVTGRYDVWVDNPDPTRAPDRYEVHAPDLSFVVCGGVIKPVGTVC